MHGDRLGWGIKGCEIFMLSFREKINKVKTLATKSLDERKILHLLMSREKVRIMHVTTLKFPFFMDGWQLFIRELNNELPCVSKEKKLLTKKMLHALHDYSFIFFTVSICQNYFTNIFFLIVMRFRIYSNFLT